MGCPFPRAQRAVSRDSNSSLPYYRRTKILHQILTRHFAGEASSGNRPYIVNSQGCVYRGKVQVYSRRTTLQQYDSICKEALRDHFARQLEYVNLFEQVHPILYDRRNPATKWYEHTGIGRIPQEISNTVPMDTRGTELLISQNCNNTTTETRECTYQQNTGCSAYGGTSGLGQGVQTVLNASTGTASANRSNAQEYWMCLNPLWPQRYFEEYLSANPSHQLREIQCVARLTIHPTGHAEIRHSSETGNTNSSNRGNAMVQHSQENNNRGHDNTNQGTTNGVGSGYTNVKIEPTEPNRPTQIPIETANNINESGSVVQLQSTTSTSTE